MARLVVGLAQGLALYLLYAADDAKVWPATDGLIFGPLVFVSLYVPLILLVSIGNLRLTTVTLWAITAAAIVAGLAWYGVWHDLPVDWKPDSSNVSEIRSHLLPAFGVFFFTAVGLFIAHALIAGGDADRRAVANYSTHFDVSWKLALQAALAIVFVGVFWGVLELGATLFSLIGIEFFRKLIEHRWFAIPATALAIAAAIHLTDVRASLVRGARTLCLVLLAWLLPLMTIIAAGFLGTLIFTGLDPLWKTKFAAGYLLTACAILVVLINAAYQDGHPDREAPRILRYAGGLAGLLLVPLTIIAGYAILLRVRQYGWTTDRVASVACLTMAAWYAAGYAAAALLPGQWLWHMERWNFFAALLALVILLAIFSPIADPMRIAVASQVARLESSQINPEQFDFGYLRVYGGRFGDTALKKLAADGMTGPSSRYVRSRAQAMLDQPAQYAYSPPQKDIVERITVHPAGRSLPAYFTSRNWQFDEQAYMTPFCLRSPDTYCDAYFIDAAGDGKEELLFLDGGASYDALFAQSPDGSWHIVSQPTSLWNCGIVTAEMRRGNFVFVAPTPPPASIWRDVRVGGMTLRFPPFEPEPQCPK